MRPTRKLLPSLPTSVIAAGLVLVAAPLVPVIASTQHHAAAAPSVAAADAFGAKTAQPAVTRTASPDLSPARVITAAKLEAARAAVREDRQDRAQRHARAVARQAQVQAQAPPPVPAQSLPPAAPSGGSPQAYALRLLGGSTIQFGCINNIWIRESGWNYQATNPNSGAYGIPQALPGSKMATAGADWQTNPLTQVRWGIGYVNSVYKSACNAWAFWQGHGYY